jgi:hypothetical protein
LDKGELNHRTAASACEADQDALPLEDGFPALAEGASWIVAAPSLTTTTAACGSPLLRSKIMTPS